MCLTFPGEVVALDALEAVVLTEGRLRRGTKLAVPESGWDSSRSSACDATNRALVGIASMPRGDGRRTYDAD